MPFWRSWCQIRRGARNCNGSCLRPGRFPVGFDEYEYVTFVQTYTGSNDTITVTFKNAGCQQRPSTSWTWIAARLAKAPFRDYPYLWSVNGPTGSKAVASVIKALVKNKYTGSIYPEHPRAFDADRDRVAPGGRLPGVCPDIRRRRVHGDRLQRGLRARDDASRAGKRSGGRLIDCLEPSLANLRIRSSTSSAFQDVRPPTWPRRRISARSTLPRIPRRSYLGDSVRS